MGFNTIIAIRNADLDLIAADHEFGKTVSNLVTSADTISYIRHREGKTKAHQSPVKLSDLPVGDKKPYEIFAAAPQHADFDQMILVTEAGLRPMNASKACDIPFRAWQDLAAVARTLGIESTVKGEYDTRKAGAVKPRETEREITSNWSPEIFEGAMTLVTILNDGTHEISSDINFGARLAVTIRKSWDVEKEVSEMHEKDEDSARGLWLQTSVRAGNFSNPADIIGFVPAGRHDIALVGGNRGRLVRPTSGIAGMTREKYDNAWVQDVNYICSEMRGAGFSVQKGCHRMVPPNSWVAKIAVDPEYLDDENEVPETSPEI